MYHVNAGNSSSTSIDESQQNINMMNAVDLKPTEISIDGSSYIFQSYSSGVITDTTCGSSTNHAVVIVGYNSVNNPPYWKVRNSWGPDWGDNGYVNIAMGAYPGICLTNYRVGYPFTAAWTG